MNKRHSGERHISAPQASTDAEVFQSDVHVTSVTSVMSNGNVVSSTSVSGTFIAESAPESPSTYEVSTSRDVVEDGHGGCFDPLVSCDAHERALIAALRAYLRPQTAPECLVTRLKATLDHCCEER